MQKKYSIGYGITSFFILLCIIFIAFPFHLFGFQQDITEAIFGRLIGFIASSLLGIQLKSTLVHSDAVSMYVLVLILFILSVILALLFQFIYKWKQYRTPLFNLVKTIACYYLALMLLKYGFDKVFKGQFYMPEPNTLYTPLGLIDKDLLYWSSMGTSRFYNVFIGLVEVVAGIMLLIKRTRMAGALLALAAMAQVVMVNFGFDISVKLYSLFLLLVALYLLQPHFHRLFRFFFSGKNVEAVSTRTENHFIRHPFLNVFFRCLIIGLILFEALYPLIKNRNINDDNVKRPYLHGAYMVNQMIAGDDTLATNEFPLKRFFVHRNGYMIFQDQQDGMQDYKFSYDTDKNKYVLTDYKLRTTELDINYQPADSVLTMRFTKEGIPMQLTGKALDWRKLPALKRSFHWTVDEY